MKNLLYILIILNSLIAQFSTFSSNIDFITILPKSEAEKEDKLPWNEPIGVLLAETITVSFRFDIIDYFINN